MAYLCEMDFRRDGKVCRKLVFAAERRDFTVYEQILKEDNIDKTKDTWLTQFLQNFPNRELARIYFMGRLVCIAQEEGNSEELNPAIYNYAKSI